MLNQDNIKNTKNITGSKNSSESETNVTNSNYNHNKDFNNRKDDNKYNRRSNKNNNNNYKMTYNANSMGKKETLTWTRNWSSENAWNYLLLKVTSTIREKLKNNDIRKKNGIYNTYHGPISQE